MRISSASHLLKLALLGSLALGPVSCGCAGEGGSGGTGTGALVVSSIETNPFIAYRAAPFVLLGSGFARGAGYVGGSPGSLQVLVTFVATEGTPFADGTSAEAQVPGTVISDTRIEGLTPPTNHPGGWQCVVQVTDALGTVPSATPIAQFVGLTVFSIDQQVIRSDVATPFTVSGLAFSPVGGQATVRFTAPSPVFPGPSAFLDVIANVASAETMSGVTPVFPLASSTATFVTVILHQEPGSPSAGSFAALTVFEPPPPIPVVVNTITSPLPLDLSTPFTITGSGFLGGGVDPDVVVTFTVASGTPFLRGTAATADVAGTASDDFTITGMSPPGTSPTDVTAFVTVTRTDGMAGTSATDIALFVAPLPTVTTFTPDVLPTDVATPFVVTGTNLPLGAATVRFRALVGTPFVGGTSATVDVPATVTSALQIDGVSPLALAPASFTSEVDVILLSGTELPMGSACTFVPPPVVPASCVVTNLLNAGPGSLRDTLLTSPVDCVITFDPSLTGSLNVASSLLVPHNVHVAGPGSNVISVSAQNGNYPVFTIQPGATAATIEGLTIRDALHNGNGGGFVVQGGLSLVRCELVNNRIHFSGGGVYVAVGASATLTECTLRQNMADAVGGGVFVAGSAAAHLERCTFYLNAAADSGGAVTGLSGATIDAVNCTFNLNSCTSGAGGGAIRVNAGTTVNLLHCTVTENFCQTRGGGVLIQAGTFTASNCIFSRNSDTQSSPEIAFLAGTNATTFSLVRVGSGSGLTNVVAGNQVGTPIVPRDPRLNPLGFNGGPTRTQTLQPGSPAIDAGDASTGTPTDQRGVARPLGAGFDLGATEAVVIL